MNSWYDWKNKTCMPTCALKTTEDLHMHSLEQRCEPSSTRRFGLKAFSLRLDRLLRYYSATIHSEADDSSHWCINPVVISRWEDYVHLKIPCSLTPSTLRRVRCCQMLEVSFFECNLHHWERDQRRYHSFNRFFYDFSCQTRCHSRQAGEEMPFRPYVKLAKYPNSWNEIWKLLKWNSTPDRCRYSYCSACRRKSSIVEICKRFFHVECVVHPTSSFGKYSSHRLCKGRSGNDSFSRRG